MPLNRYQLRNEYNLADPELYKIADKDDPEALLEGVAMAGLVGVLRQLGDLAEFAAEIFHDLHEEVMATAARGHGLIVRVQQLEAEFPSIEKTLLSQTSHTAFLYNTGVDWHPNLRADQSVVTRGDLPRFVMDSYEECRGPPRLFLLDKYDVAGAGACLKRLTDPSFFKMESISSTGRKLEGQREKKTRRVKKRGPRWKNGDTPESFPSSHAKLHQLFLEERIESGINDPARRVKLKKRQFTGSLFEQDNVRSYMEKFLDTSIPEQKILHEICIDPLQLTWTSDKACEAGLEIVDIGTVSPVKESRQTNRSLCSSPDARKMVVDPSMDLNQDKLNVENDHEIVEVPGLNDENNDSNVSTIPKGVNVDDACEFDDVASEIDNYVDALANIESEVETDSECKKNPRYLNWKPIVADSDGSERYRELQSVSLDSQSVGNSATSEDGDSFLKGRESSSCSNSVNNLIETAPDLDAAVVAVPTIQVSNSDFDSMSFDHHSTSEEIFRKEREEHAAASTVHAEVDDFFKSKQEFAEALKTSPVADLNTKILPVDRGASLSEIPSVPVLENSAKHDVVLGETDRGDTIQATIMSSHTTFSDASEDSGHCFGAESCIHDKECQNTSLYPDTPRGVSNISDGSVHLLETDSCTSACSLVEGYGKDSRSADIDSCPDSGPTSQHQPVSEPMYLEKKDSIYLPCEEDFFIPSTEENSKDSYSASDSFVSFGIQELLPGAANTGHAPSLNFEAGNLSCSQEDPSVENSISISDERVPSASHASQAGKPAISGQLQSCVQEFSSSEFTEAVEYGLLEADVAVVASSKDESFGEISEYADQKVADDSFEVGKSSPTIDPLETQPEWLKLLSEAADTTLLEVCQDEASKKYYENDICTGYPVSVCGNEGESALHGGLSEREPVSQDFTCIYPDQTKVFEPDTAMVDPASEAATIQGEAKIDHDPASQDGDEDRIFYYDASSQDMPFKRGYDPDYVLVAKNDPDINHDVEKVEHAEIVADGLGKDEVEDYHNEKGTTLSSSLSLHPEEHHEPPHLDTQQFWQNDEELTKGHRGELTESRQLDLVQDASVTSPANLCNISPDDSPPLISLDDSLPEDVKKSGKLAAESLSASEKSSEHLESTSSHKINLLEANHLDLLGHNPLKRDGNEKEKSSGAASLHYDDQPVVPESSPQPVKHTQENSSLAFHGNGMLSGASQVTQVENSCQPLCQSGLPDLGKSTAEPRINLEPPSLPPLPPMQWRLGKFRNASAASAERQMVQHPPVPVQVPSMSLPTMHHNLAPVQSMNLSAVHHALASFQPVTLAAANGTVSPIPLTTQPAILPAVHYAYAPLQPVTLPTRDYGIDTISRTFSSEGQLGYSDGYLAQQGVFTLPMPVAVSEGFYQINSSATRRRDNLPSTVPSPSKSLDGYVTQQGVLLTPVPAVFSEGTSQSDKNGVGRQESQPFLVTSSPTISLNGTQTSEESNQPNVDGLESGSVVEDHFSEHSSLIEAKVNVETGIQNELPEHDPQFPEEAVNFSSDLAKDQVLPALVAPETEKTCANAYDTTPVHADGIVNETLQKKPPRPRNPLIDEVVAIDKSKLRKVDRTKPSSESKPEEGESLLEQLQLRRVERVKPSMESKVEGGEYRLEHSQLRKVGERVKLSVEQKADEEFPLEQLQLRKVGERVKPSVEPKSEEREFLPEQLQLRKIGLMAKQETELKVEETGSPLAHLRKVRERVKDEVELKSEETESPRVQLRKVGERTQPQVGQKVEERDSLFEQIRNKSFNLKPAVSARPNIQGPRTNLKVAAILEKASTIRQAMAGSDEDDDADNWSDS